MSTIDPARLINEHPHKDRLCFRESKNLFDYQDILERLAPATSEHTTNLYEIILGWCRIVKNKFRPTYWKLWLITDPDGKVMGICGVYGEESCKSLKLDFTSLLPEFTNQGRLKMVYDFLTEHAVKIGKSISNPYRFLGASGA